MAVKPKERQPQDGALSAKRDINCLFNEWLSLRAQSATVLVDRRSIGEATCRVLGAVTGCPILDFIKLCVDRRKLLVLLVGNLV